MYEIKIPYVATFGDTSSQGPTIFAERTCGYILWAWRAFVGRGGSATEAIAGSGFADIPRVDVLGCFTSAGCTSLWRYTFVVRCARP